MSNNWKYAPRTGTYNDTSIVDEEHTIAFDSDANAYGFRLNEGPVRSNPSTVTVVESAPGGSSFTEITARTAPSAGEFWVDYDADGYTGTGFVECNASDNGTAVLVSYRGLGTMVSDASVAVLSNNNTFTGNNSFTGTTSFDGPIENSSTTFGLNIASNGTIRHYGTPVWGYDISGDPVYCKILTGTTIAGTNYVSHSITGSPVTNGKIVDFDVMLLRASPLRLYKQDLENSGGSSYATIAKYITDTTVTFTQSTLLAGVTYYIRILYKK